MNPNRNYQALKDSYLFYTIAEKTRAYAAAHPGEKLYRMGIGDVSLPLPPVVIQAMHRAVDEQARAETFHGYLPECGTDFLRRTVAEFYGRRGVRLTPEEVFITSGAGDELGNLLDLFGPGNRALVLEPAYPAYVDTNLMAGREILRLDANRDNGFLPLPDPALEADLIYICSPNNPTGAAYDRAGLQQWVDYANKRRAVILFDAAYEAFVEDPEIPHSIFELPGARTCAIEICSLSKTAGFTGTRLGYTLVPRELERDGMDLHAMWVRNRTTKSNGISYILQRGAEAVFTPEGWQQCMENIRVYKRNGKCFTDVFDRLGLWYTGGVNAPYVWVKCPDGQGGWEFFDRLLNEIQVIGTPGEGFGACGAGFFRFSAFGSPADTREAAGRLLDLLSK